MPHNRAPTRPHRSPPKWHAVQMFDDRALAFLGEVRFARLATIGRDGFPHNVPIWFDLEPAADGTHDLLFVSDRAATKTRNALADPRAGVTVGGDRSDTQGYLIRGTITVEDDPGQVVTHRMIDRYEAGTPSRRGTARGLEGRRHRRASPPPDVDHQRLGLRLEPLLSRRCRPKCRARPRLAGSANACGSGARRAP